MGISYLLDTHILLWWLFDDPKLNSECREIIRNSSNQIFVSSATAWEIATKYRLGKLPEAKPLVESYSQLLTQAQFSELVITATQALRSGSLPISHRDPFDRMLMAQAEQENLTLITYDSAFQTGFISIFPPAKSLP